ncbi:reverse transcriptase domain-containing protein [Tanacetum coccineum]
MPPRKNRNLNEVHEQKLEDRVMARIEERFDQFIDQLSDQMDQLMNRRGNRNGRGNRNVRCTNDELSKNPFGEDDDSSSNDKSRRRPMRNQREDNRQVFEFKEVPENKRVSLIATKLCDRASAWWQQLNLTRDRVGMPRITSWQKIKKCMRANFIPHNYQRQMYQQLQNLKQGSKSVEDYSSEFYQLIAMNDIQETKDQLVSRYIGGLRVQIMDYVNMFDLMTLIDAYQRALAFEKQNRQVGSSSSPAITGASGSGNVASHFAPNQAKIGGGNTGLSECKNAGKRYLFADPEGDDDAAYEEYEEAPVYDEEPKHEEEYVSGDVG